MSRALAIGCLILALVKNTAFAGCIEDAIPELRPGTQLTILKTDGTRVRATFVRAEPSGWVLNSAPVYARRSPRRLELSPSDIGRLDASTPSHTSGRKFIFSVLSGFVLGVVMGSVVPVDDSYSYAVATGDYPPDPRDVLDLGYGEKRKVLRWGVSGALVGTIVGSAIAGVRGKPRSWTCSDSAPAAAPAVADSIR
jgi:hypothetical protein